MRLRAQRAEGNAWRDQALADRGDAFHLFNRLGVMARFKGQQITQIDRPVAADRVAILLIQVVTVVRAGHLQSVNHTPFEGVPLAALAQTILSAHRQRHHGAIEGPLMHVHDPLLKALKAEPGNPRGHAREMTGDQRARQANGLEVIAAAIGRKDRDAHFRHDFQKAILDRLLEMSDGGGQRNAVEQTAGMAVGNRLLSDIGVDGGAADTDQDREVMHVQAFAGAHIERGKGAQLLAH